jgi:hypothetical protein
MSIVQSNVASSATGADKGLTTPYLGTLWQSLGSVANNNIAPAWRREVTNVFGTTRLISMIDMFSSVSTRPSTTFYHREQGYAQDALIIQTTTSGAAGASVTLTITSGSLAGTKSPVAEGFTVVFKDGSYGQITSVPTESTMVVAPALSTQAISVTAGDSLIYAPASSVLEGSCMGNSAAQVLPTTFTNTMQQVRLDEEITDQAWVSFSKEITYTNWAAADGKSYPCWTTAALINRETQFHNAREVVLLMGRSYSNTTLTTAGYQGTNGIIPTIQSYGNIQPYFAGAGVQIDDFEDMCIQMEKQHAPREYIVSAGIECNRDIFKCIKEYFPNGAVTYGAFPNGQMNLETGKSMTSQETAIQWGFTSVGLMGRTFHLQNNEIFNHPSFLGAGGYNFIGSAILMPATKTTNAGQEVGYVETVRLEGMCNGTLGYQHTVTDGTGMVSGQYYVPLTCRRIIFTWLDMFGVEIFGARQLFMLQRS